MGPLRESDGNDGKAPKWLKAVLAVFFIFVLAIVATRVFAESVAGVCTGPQSPCLTWTVQMQKPLGHPSVVLNRCWDCERPDEGMLHVNSCSLPLFGGLASMRNDNRELPRISYEVLESCWLPGSNVVRIVWTTNQSASVHAVRGGIAVEYQPAPNFPPAGCKYGTVQPSADYWSTVLVRRCSNGADAITTNIITISPETVRAIWAVVRGMMLNEPVDFDDPHLYWTPTDARPYVCRVWPEFEQICS